MDGPQRKNLRVGIWCVWTTGDLSGTIQPHDGIGVFLHNLIEGLLRHPEEPELVLWVQPGDQTQFQSLFPDRVTVLAPTFKAAPPRFFSAKPWARHWNQAWSHGSEAIAESHAAVNRLKRIVKDWGLRYLRRIANGGIAARLTAFLTLPAIVLGLWGAFTVVTVAISVLTCLLFPLRLANLAIRRFDRHSALAPSSCETAVPDELNDAVDIWVAPSMYCSVPTHFHYICLIHDVVTAHFPRDFPRPLLDYVDHLVLKHRRHATFIACMSRFIRNHDLIGTLGLPPEKTRVVVSAIPHLRSTTNAKTPWSLPGPLRQARYLTYPTMDRPHKNIASLIQTLKRLHQDPAYADLHLVLTTQSTTLSPKLMDLVAAFKLKDRVHCLGTLERDGVREVYSHAVLTVVTSVYEQASYQVPESIQCGCPAICSRIEAFTDQLAPLGDALLTFDPYDIDGIASTVKHALTHRETLLRTQRERAQPILTRSWVTVADEWMGVFREAAAIRQRGEQALFPPSPGDRFDVCLCLPSPRRGRPWIATKDLVTALVHLNRNEKRLRLRLALHPDQKDTAFAKPLEEELSLLRSWLDEFDYREIDKLAPGASIVPRPTYLFFEARTRPQLLGCDAWFFLDPVTRPVPEIRPYGVLARDMAWAPTVSDSAEAADLRRDTIPFLKQASRLVATTPEMREAMASLVGLDDCREVGMPLLTNLTPQGEAEQIYDVLMKLGHEGRQLRTGTPSDDAVTAPRKISA